MKIDEELGNKLRGVYPDLFPIIEDIVKEINEKNSLLHVEKASDVVLENIIESTDKNGSSYKLPPADVIEKMSFDDLVQEIVAASRGNFEVTSLVSALRLERCLLIKQSNDALAEKTRLSSLVESIEKNSMDERQKWKTQIDLLKEKISEMERVAPENLHEIYKMHEWPNVIDAIKLDRQKSDLFDEMSKILSKFNERKWLNDTSSTYTPTDGILDLRVIAKKLHKEKEMKSN